MTQYASKDQDGHSRDELAPTISFLEDTLLSIPGVLNTFVGGSWIRGKDRCGDIDIAIQVKDEMFNHTVFNPLFALCDGGVTPHGGGVQGRIQYEGIQVDLWTGMEDFWGPLCMFVAGSGFFNVIQRKRASRKGWTLGHRGITKPGNSEVYLTPNELAAYNLLEFDWVDYPDRDLPFPNRK